MSVFTVLSGTKALNAYLIFFVTISLVFWKPRYFGVTATLGAIVALITGVVTHKDIPFVWSIVGNATITLVALIIISLILDEAGVFRWLAFHITRWGWGQGRSLFRLVILLAAVVTALLTNDGTALIITPVVLEMFLDLEFSSSGILAFVVAVGFISDATSLPLTISNLTNIITADYFDISFAKYAQVMVPVNLVAITASFIVLWYYFYPYIPPRYSLPTRTPPQQLIRDPIVFRAGFFILLLLLIGYFAAEPLGIPVSLVASCGALILLALAGRWFQPSSARVIKLELVLQQAPWQVILFSMGMYLVVLGMHHAGLTSLLSQGLEKLSQQGTTFATIATGVSAALLSGVMNNLPTVLIDSLAIKNATHINSVTREMMIYANVIGCAVGAKITPFGSLCTLLWLEIITRKGVSINWLEYLQIHLILTIPVLLATLLGLTLWLS
ncbi:MAG: arsenical efflux pump membrane protein ArsB [Nostocaceae cyanobacterium]|nr:arsenical efflux pump membrane protein ArsB [Nostocaceae cyanobacterium]